MLSLKFRPEWPNFFSRCPKLFYVLVVVVFSLSLPTRCVEKEQDPSRIQIDIEAGEVSIPCLFVNPTQRLEVFACHNSGPTHETVLAFREIGEDIYTALLELGFRSPDSFWNVTRDATLSNTDISVNNAPL